MFGAEWSGCASACGCGEAVVDLIVTCALSVNEVTALLDTVMGSTVGKKVNAPTIFIGVAQFDVFIMCSPQKLSFKPRKVDITATAVAGKVTPGRVLVQYLSA